MISYQTDIGVSCCAGSHFVERTVAAAEIEFVIRIETCKESIGIGDLCDVLENQFLAA